MIYILEIQNFQYIYTECHNISLRLDKYKVATIKEIGRTLKGALPTIFILKG